MKAVFAAVMLPYIIELLSLNERIVCLKDDIGIHNGRLIIRRLCKNAIFCNGLWDYVHQNERASGGICIFCDGISSNKRLLGKSATRVLSGRIDKADGCSPC